MLYLVLEVHPASRRCKLIPVTARQSTGSRHSGDLAPDQVLSVHQAHTKARPLERNGQDLVHRCERSLEFTVLRHTWFDSCST